MRRTLLFVFLSVFVVPLSYAQQIAGTWTGGASSRALWGGVLLQLSHSGDNWVGNGSVQFEGRQRPSEVTGLKIDGPRISFQMTWEGHVLRFQGLLEGDRLRGTFAVEINGESVSGDWDLIRLAPAGSERIELPDTTGPYAVGRTTLHWIDEKRKEIAKPDSQDKREFIAYVWYPTAHVQQRAPYLPDLHEMEKVLPSKVAANMRQLTVAAQQDGHLIAGAERFPVVIFSPGAGVKTLFYSALQTELASHGYVVVALEHPYDAPVVVFPDGRILYSLPPKKSSNSAEGERQEMEKAADYRARDIVFANGKLSEVAADTRSLFRNRLDLHRVAVVGHSIGGMAALRACQLEERIGACVNIDGAYRARPYPSDRPLGLRQPAMWLRRPLYVFTDAQLHGIGMTRGEFNAEILLGQQLLGGSRGGDLDVQLPQAGIDHMDFSDVRVLESGVSREDRAARLLTMEMEREWVLDFVGKSLDGQPVRASLIDTAARYREAHLSVYDQSKQ